MQYQWPASNLTTEQGTIIQQPVVQPAPTSPGTSMQGVSPNDGYGTQGYATRFYPYRVDDANCTVNMSSIAQEVTQGIIGNASQSIAVQGVASNARRGWFL